MDCPPPIAVNCTVPPHALYSGMGVFEYVVNVPTFKVPLLVTETNDPKSLNAPMSKVSFVPTTKEPLILISPVTVFLPAPLEVRLLYIPGTIDCPAVGAL